MHSVRVLLQSPSLEHKVAGNTNSVSVYLSRQRHWTVETLKSELMESFGLFDMSHGSATDADDVDTQDDSYEFKKECRNGELKNRFNVSVRFFLDDRDQLLK